MTTIGQDLIAAVNEAIAYEKGELKLRTQHVALAEPPKAWTTDQIVKLRKEKLKLSQPIFAGLLAVSPKTVRAWEQGKNTPSPIASRFLQVLDKHPDLADEHLTPKSSRAT